jgi:hypothetical protein
MIRRRSRAFVVVSLAAVAVAAPAFAAGPDLVAARVEGAWRFTVTVAPYTSPGQTSGFDGPAIPTASLPPGLPSVGGRVDETVTIVPTCSAADACVLVLHIANINPTTLAAPSGLTEPDPVMEPTMQSGATYEAHANGFGAGPCQAVDAAPRSFMGQLILTVTDARLEADGWHATAMTGSEINVLSFCRKLGDPPESLYAHLTISQAVALSTSAVTTTTQAPGTSVATTVAVPVTPSASHPRLTNSGPSALASGLASPSQAFSSSHRTIVNALIAVGVVLFIVFPAQLFNKTFEENYDTIRAWWVRRTQFLRHRTSNLRAPNPARDWRAFVGVVAVGGALGGLLSPRFGANGGSVASYLATVLAITSGVSVSFFVNRQYHRARREDLTWRLKAVPAGLVVAAACVVISRATHFVPGYLYGLIVGVQFTAPLGRREQGQLVAIATTTSMVLGALAWLIWVPVNTSAQHGGALFPLVVIDDLLASMFVAAVVGTVLSMIPLRFLPGHALFHWHRGVWSAVFGIAAFGLIEVMLHPGSGPAKPASAPWVTAVTLFVVFAGISVGFNRYFAHRTRLQPT